MGKRYYCDYCDKSMVATPSIIRTHINGLVHQKIVQEHYQQHKDPEVILAEESPKKPCLRYASGNCQFGALCRFSHFTQEQLNDLKEYVAKRKANSSVINQPSFQDLYQQLQEKKTVKPPSEETTTLFDDNGVTHVFPWVYSERFSGYNDLPPSLRRIEISNFETDCYSEWGA